MKKGEVSRVPYNPLAEGLSQYKADELLKTFGLNEIKNVKKISIIHILWDQVRKNYVIYLLLIALIISITVSKYTTAYTIGGVIATVIIVGFFQEYKAEKAVEALKNMLTSTTTVIRDGKECNVPTTVLVPEDVIILRSGDKVPADCILLECKDLKVNESVLTGESTEQSKKAVIRGDIKDATNDNQVFMGTFITNGRCIAKIQHTGMNTKFGNIASMISTAEKELPLQNKINTIIKYMVIIGLSLSTIAGIITFTRADPMNYAAFVEALVMVLALSIAAFPEGFPVVLITTLAYGAFRMAQKNAIINRMSIIETLGETTVICSDKTGTITTGEMTVKKILVDDKILDVSGAGYSLNGDIQYKGIKVKATIKDNPTLYEILRAAVVCNDSKIEQSGAQNGNKEYKIRGSSTEGSLLILAAKAGIYREDIRHERIAEIPFNSDRKMMSVLVNCIHETDSFKAVCSKGAPENMLKKCRYIMINGSKKRLTTADSQAILKRVQNLTSTSYRAIAIACRELDKTDKSLKAKDTKNLVTNMEQDLTLLGILFMEDPPRPEVSESIKVCHDAGVSVKMITGDSKETAEAIAVQIGLTGNSISGEELDLKTDDELAKFVKDIAIFYRVRPEHKLKIVRALKANGEVVTMTGDGVNDAPALKEAHIGVAMGKNGTDVSRESADLILKDDKFSTIVDAIKEGRTIFNNIQKFTTYQTSINIAQVMLILASLILGLPLPLVAMQILFMNILSDDITSVTFAFNKYSSDVMNKPPRRKSESEIITRPILALMLIAGVMMTIGAVGMFYYMINILHEPLAVARTATFAAMTMLATVNAYNFRSFRKRVISTMTFSNRQLLYAATFSMLSVLLIIYTPLNKVFELVPIGFTEWIIAAGLALSLVILFDAIKSLNNRYGIIDRLAKKE